MRMFCFDLIRNGDLVLHLHYDESVATYSFVVVNADTNLIFKDVSDMKELTCGSCLVLKRTLVECDRGALATEARQHRQQAWTKASHPCAIGRCSLLRS